jgi:hypothetical protein
MKKSFELFITIFSLLVFFLALPAYSSNQPVNYYYEKGAILDVIDNIGDDKGPGYYQYPLDQRIRRGTFDIKRFTVYEEGGVVVFEIQMRNYIMRYWPDTRQSEDQGFVANLWDIYVDVDGIPGSGYKSSLPGRDLLFSDEMGWEKVIMVTPLSEYEVFSILRNKTDELDFQNQIDDVLYPDYVRVQRDKIIVKISKKKLPGFSQKSGFQCFAMGFKKIVSPNRLLNRDVRAFPTQEDFGGGHDTYGDPPVMDMIVPEGDDQYKLLRNYRSEPYRENIRYADVPFVYKKGQRQSPRLSSSLPAKESLAPVKIKTPVSSSNSDKKSGFIKLEPVTRPEDLKLKPESEVPDGFVPMEKQP